MTPRRWIAEIAFYSETPDDDGEADVFADNLTSWIEDALHALPAIMDGTVSVEELDTVNEDE